MPTRKIAQLGKEPREIEAPDGTRVKFYWPAGKDPTEPDLDRIVSDYKLGTEGKKLGFKEDPTNLPWYSPSRYLTEAGIGSMVPQGLADLMGRATDPYLPESKPALQTGQLIQEPVLSAPEYGMFPQEKDIQAKASYVPATPVDVGITGAGRDIYEKAIRPMSSGLGIAATVAGGGLVTAPARAAMTAAPILPKLLGYGAEAAMIPSTYEAGKQFIKDPSLETGQDLALQGGMQALGRVGSMAARTPEVVPSVSEAPPVQTQKLLPAIGETGLLEPSPQKTVTSPKGKVQGPAIPMTGSRKPFPIEEEPLDLNVSPPQRTPSRETILTNRINSLKKSRTGISPSQLSEMNSEINSLQAELDSLKKVDEIPSTSGVKVTDTRSVKPESGELAKKAMVPKFVEKEPLKVIDTRTQVNEPAPRELPTGYQGFDREKLLSERLEEGAEKGAAGTVVEPPKIRETKVPKKGSKTVSEPGFEPIENGYHIKVLKNGNVKLRSPDGKVEVYANEDYARSQANKGKSRGREFSEKDVDEPGEALTGEIMPDEREWKISRKNPNRIFMTERVKAKFDEARGGQYTLGSSIYNISKSAIENTRKFDPTLAAELERIKASNKPLEVARVDKTPSGKLERGTAVETAQHEGTHATIAELGGLHRYIDYEKFMEHPVAKKLAERIRSRGYPEGDMADEIFANAMSGGSNRKDITPNMLGDFLRDHVDAMIEMNPEKGYKILRNMSGPVREAVIYGGDKEFTAKTGRGFAEWKRKQSRVEHQIDKKSEEARQEGIPEDEIRAHRKRYGFDEQSQKDVDKAIEKDPTLERSGEKGALRLKMVDDVSKIAKGTRDFLVGSIQGRLGRMGLSGKQFKVKFERVRINERTLGEGWNHRFEESIKDLSKSERNNLTEVFNGTAQPVNPKVSTAAGKIRTLDQEVQQRAQVHGIPTNNPWQNSRDMLKMNEYLIDAAKRVSHAKEFGANVLDNFIATSKDPKKMRELTKYLFDDTTYARQDPTGKAVAHVGARFEAFSKLAYFVVSNIANTGAIPLNTSFKNFAKGIAFAATKEGNLKAKLGGAHWEATRNEMLDAGKTGALAKFSLNKSLGITGSEKIQRTVAFGAGRAAAKDWFKTAKANPNSWRGKVARKQLNDFLLPEGGSAKVLQQAALTEEQLQFAGARMAERTHGFAEKYDLPKSWTSTSWAAIPTMFKRYSLVGTNNIIRAIKVDPIRGIPKLLMLSQIYGEVIGDLKKGVQGGLEGFEKDQDILEAAWKKIQERGQYPKYKWEKDTEISPETIAAGKRLLDNAMQSWFLGMPADAVQAGALKGEKGLLEFLVGPMISDTAKLASGEMKKTDLLPQPARPIFNKVFPPEEKKRNPSIMPRGMKLPRVTPPPQ